MQHHPHLATLIHGYWDLIFGFIFRFFLLISLALIFRSPAHTP